MTNKKDVGSHASGRVDVAELQQPADPSVVQKLLKDAPPMELMSEGQLRNSIDDATLKGLVAEKERAAKLAAMPDGGLSLQPKENEGQTWATRSTSNRQQRTR